ncbi:ferredoxin reductase-like protein [Eremomyces bilateralis CBS 781.70]|uniref:Oxidoreductase NAD-binding domain-containing protein 1 n=1 Tax=Eremomyces bilateralis CBS 781.70 TaxID=1392243 RepID=A0A6G1GBV8_9PEZI|nr:ferredoxin reductase-like protein [Eremomyces bilateralis CBS 781.70]KAF1815426.1 ferredoxin reductase-like protein [Eremomyces bilateralis CBS 781.70]
MYTSKQNLPHEERTASEPRGSDLHTVKIRSVKQVNQDIRVFKLGIESGPGIQFRPGQWLDVHVPSVPKAGGFTITSPPEAALPPEDNDHAGPYLELAIQYSSENPPVDWLWQPPDILMHQNLNVRVGGSFVWPPAEIPPETIEGAIFVAGGVGINPLISMLTHLSISGPFPRKVHIIYSTKCEPLISPPEILFLPRLIALADRHPSDLYLQLHVTSIERAKSSVEKLWACDHLRLQFGRVKRVAIANVVEGWRREEVSPKRSVGYVCGPPAMTDKMVKCLKDMGLPKERVFCEKWW